jgi:myo-inositol-1(or 4)-monophosphatase
VRSIDLERALIESTERVRKRVDEIAKTGRRNRSLGIGASGDRTIFADKEAEDEIVDTISRVGEIGVLSEEAGWVGDLEADTLAIVDPLDGSSNFERGIPFYCSSIAVAKGRTLNDVFLAVVRDLVSGTVYVARKGRGAKKGGRPIVTSRAKRLDEDVVGIDMSRGTRGLLQGLVPILVGAKRQVHFGANALELCFLSDGNIDAFVDLRGRIRISDFAASYLIAKEAGAVITDPDGGPLNPAFELGRGFSFVASANPRLHKDILKHLQPSGAG